MHEQMKGEAMTDTTLGEQLREVRGLRKLSLKSVADPAGISTAYLQKLERDEVKSPSPHVLHRLAEVLRVPYPRLMELAGYVVPIAGAARAEPQNLLAHALSSEELSDDEQRELARYLSWYRHNRAQERS
jgi:HTH-type transcriptional regulator, competence development regulator